MAMASAAGMTPSAIMRNVIGVVASKYDTTLSPDVFDVLMEGSKQYLANNPSALPIDDDKLRDQVDDIIAELDDELRNQGVGGVQGKIVTGDQIRRVLKRISCHYLWLC